MDSSAWPVVGSIGAAIIAALLAPYLARRAAAKENARHEAVSNATRLQSAEASQIDRLFKEQDDMRAQYREDIADLRERLMESEKLREAQGKRLSVLELEVAEWRAGTKGVVGVWVAVPASIWDYVRTQVPNLPPTRFPGEADGELPPADI